MGQPHPIVVGTEARRRLKVGVLRVSAILIVVFAFVVTGCGGGGSSGSDRLTVLSSVSPVENAFNADRGHPRLVLILSPT
jgi:hypothetical protein